MRGSASPRQLRGTTVRPGGDRLAWLVSEPAELPEPARPLLVICNGLANDSTQWEAYFEHWAPRYRFLYVDVRGHGLSSAAADPAAITVGTCCDDLEAVLAAVDGTVRLDSVVLVAYSLGAQVALEFCHRAAQRSSGARPTVEGLVSVMGTCEPPLTALLNPPVWPVPQLLALGPLAIPSVRAALPAPASAVLLCIGLCATQLLQLLLALARGALVLALDGLIRAPLVAELVHWLVVSAGLQVPYLIYWLNCALGVMEFSTSYAIAHKFFLHLAKMDPRSMLGFLLATQRHSALELLPDLRMPALVIQAGRDLMVPLAHGRKLASGLKASQYVLLPKASHMGLSGHATEIMQHIDTFMATQVHGEAPAEVGPNGGGLKK